MLKVKRDGFPSKAFDFHPGSYIWLSVDVPDEHRYGFGAFPNPDTLFYLSAGDCLSIQFVHLPTRD